MCEKDNENISESLMSLANKISKPIQKIFLSSQFVYSISGFQLVKEKISNIDGNLDNLVH